MTYMYKKPNGMARVSMMVYNKPYRTSGTGRYKYTICDLDSFYKNLKVPVGI